MLGLALLRTGQGPVCGAALTLLHHSLFSQRYGAVSLMPLQLGSHCLVPDTVPPHTFFTSRLALKLQDTAQPHALPWSLTVAVSFLWPFPCYGAMCLSVTLVCKPFGFFSPAINVNSYLKKSFLSPHLLFKTCNSSVQAGFKPLTLLQEK